MTSSGVRSIDNDRLSGSRALSARPFSLVCPAPVRVLGSPTSEVVSHACTTFSTPKLGDPSVLSGELMTVHAVGSARIPGWATLSAREINRWSDDLDVIRIHARRRSAQMVRVHEGWIGERADYGFVSEPVGLNKLAPPILASTHKEDSVPALVLAGGPQPTRAEVWPSSGQGPFLVNLWPEAFFQNMLGEHSEPPIPGAMPRAVSAAPRLIRASILPPGDRWRGPHPSNTKTGKKHSPPHGRHAGHAKALRELKWRAWRRTSRAKMRETVRA